MEAEIKNTERKIDDLKVKLNNLLRKSSNNVNQSTEKLLIFFNLPVS